MCAWKERLAFANGPSYETPTHTHTSTSSVDYCLAPSESMEHALLCYVYCKVLALQDWSWKPCEFVHLVWPWASIKNIYPWYIALETMKLHNKYTLYLSTKTCTIHTCIQLKNVKRITVCWTFSFDCVWLCGKRALWAGLSAGAAPHSQSYAWTQGVHVFVAWR